MTIQLHHILACCSIEIGLLSQKYTEAVASVCFHSVSALRQSTPGASRAVRLRQDAENSHEQPHDITTL